MNRCSRNAARAWYGAWPAGSERAGARNPRQVMRRTRAAILVNFIPPQRVSFYRALAGEFDVARFFLSTDMESNRQWTVDTASLDVELQRSLTFPVRWRHPLGSGGEAYVHLPLKTVGDLEHFQPDVVISAELGARTALAALYCKMRNTPLVIWVDVGESTELGRGVLRRGLRWTLLRTASAVAVNGRSGARYVMRFGVKASRVAIVPPPLEAPYRSMIARPPRHDSCRRLLYSGRLLGIKGVAQFLKALARCVASTPSSHVQMTFVGAGPEGEALGRIETPPNLRVVLQGELPYEQMPSVYGEHDVLVLPTYGDTWGQVVAEGMACGLPVLGSHLSQAAEELVEDSVTGWLFDPVSPSDMERAIRRSLAADEMTLRLMGDAARRTACKLTPEHSAEAMMRAVATAVEIRHASAATAPQQRRRRGHRVCGWVETVPRPQPRDDRARGETTHHTVALLTNFLPPYRVPLFRALQGRVCALKILMSTRMEPNRHWDCETVGLDVQIQKCLTFLKTWRHPAGFREDGYVHIPYGTFFALQRLRPGVVISAELGTRSLLALLYRKGRGGRHSRLILWATLSERTEQNRGFVREGLRRLLLRAADGVIVNGASGSRYVRRLGAVQNRVFAVPYPIGIEGFMQIPLARKPADSFRLLYVGSLEERKGLRPFLTVLCRWVESHPEREIQFWMAGGGSLEEWLRSLAPPRNLSVRLLGQVPYEGLPSIYGQCGVFVFPTLADEWGLVVNEAMASGLPVLGSIYSQAVEELVEDGVNGWLVRPDRGEELYQALGRVFDTPTASLNQMRVNARKRVEGLTPDWAAEEILKVIDHVCGSDTAGS